VNDLETAGRLSERVGMEVSALAERLSAELGIPAHWVYADIVYFATQRARELHVRELSTKKEGQATAWPASSL